MFNVSGSETSVSSSMPTSAIIYDAYTSIIKIKKKSFEGNEHSTQSNSQVLYHQPALQFKICLKKYLIIILKTYNNLMLSP